MSKIHSAINMSDAILLVQNGFLPLPLPFDNFQHVEKGRMQALGTVLANMASFGYAPSHKAIEQLLRLNNSEIIEFWTHLEPALKHITGADRNMSEYVVYKNFPQETLEMDKATYWFNQVLMYVGFPSVLFTETVKERNPISEKITLKVLDAEQPDSMSVIYSKLKSISGIWTDVQKAQAVHLLKNTPGQTINLDDFEFKVNGVFLAASAFEDVLAQNISLEISNATDVLRLAAAMSNGDETLRKRTTFKKFSRPERRALLTALEGTQNITDDFALRPEQWKRLLSLLHPGEFKFTRVSAAYDKLYTGNIQSYSKTVEPLLKLQDDNVLSHLKTRPGDFLRRLHKTYSLFGRKALEAFGEVAGQLTTMQLLKLSSYLQTVNNRADFLATPRGSWTKAKIVDNAKTPFDEADLEFIQNVLSQNISARLNVLHPEGFQVESSTKNIKLQSSSQNLATYGRGTQFDMPDEIGFLRIASYWKLKSDDGDCNWFDVGVNFFDEKWKPAGTVTWCQPIESDVAVFSGDPVNSQHVEGCATQLIDIYPERALANGMRYAVWSILSYNNIPFGNADDILATLQWGEDPQAGELFEPSRAQMVFPIIGESLSKYVAYIDLVERKLVYMDIDLGSNTSSAGANIDKVGSFMRPLLDHLEAQPSVYDLFKHGKAGDIPVLTSDEGLVVEGKAYVLKRVVEDNEIEQIDLEAILTSTDEVLEKEFNLDEQVKFTR